MSFYGLKNMKINSNLNLNKKSKINDNNFEIKTLLKVLYDQLNIKNKIFSISNIATIVYGLQVYYLFIFIYFFLFIYLFFSYLFFYLFFDNFYL
jgi:hypothetical protein